MKKLFLTLLIATLLIWVSSCVKDISYDGQSLQHKQLLLIEGILFPDETAKIYVSNSVSFFNEKVLPQEIFARNAQVFLTTDSWSEELQPDSLFDKFRCRWVPFYGGTELVEYGRTYALEVRYEGAVYSASTTIDQPKVNLTDVTYIEEFHDVYGGHDGVVISYTDVPGTGNFYRFQMDRWIDNTRNHAHVFDGLPNTCTEAGELFFTRDLGRVIFSDALGDGGTMQQEVEVAFEYKKGDTATVYLQSLDRESAAFFKDLDEQLQSILNPFVEPSFLHSTIEGTLGVFGSAVRSDPVFFTYPQDNP